MLLRLLLAPFVPSIGYAEQMTHHHSWLSPISFTSVGRAALSAASTAFDVWMEFYTRRFEIQGRGKMGLGRVRAFCPLFLCTTTSSGFIAFVAFVFEFA